MLPFRAAWCREPDAITKALGYTKFYSRSHDAVIRVYDGGWQCDPDARARGQFQKVVAFLFTRSALASVYLVRVPE
jgi:hypothetical protein